MGAYHGSEMNNRRKLIVALCAGVLAAPLAVLAQQQGRVLRIGWLCRAEYEWGHHVAIGKQAGLSDDDLKRIAEGPDAPGLDQALDPAGDGGLQLPQQPELLGEVAGAIEARGRRTHRRPRAKIPTLLVRFAIRSIVPMFAFRRRSIWRSKTIGGTCGVVEKNHQRHRACMSEQQETTTCCHRELQKSKLRTDPETLKRSVGSNTGRKSKTE